MQYQIYDRKVFDTPIKTRVTLDVVVSGDINKENLDSLLDQLFVSESQKSEFKYSTFPGHLFFYIYASEEHAKSGQAQWLAMLSRIGIDGVVEKSYREDYINQLKMPDEVKYGLSESIRQQIWREIVIAERKSRKDADEYYPIDPSRSQQVGQSLILGRKTPLMPSIGDEFNNQSWRDRLNELIEQVVILPPKTKLLVAATQTVKEVVWYLVEARNIEGDFIGKGWINGIALIGQTYMSTPEQLQSHTGINQNLNANALDQIAKLHHLTLEQIHEISVEALTKNWPFPVHE